MFIGRQIIDLIRRALNRGKSVLLLGARQTGKTTLMKNQIASDRYYNFINLEVRQRYEKDPAALGREIITAAKDKNGNFLVVIDEIQKVPVILDVVQELIDDKIAQFILTGSSARKLKHGANLNLLPGRVVSLKMDPLNITELPQPLPEIEDLLRYGSLPGIVTEPSVPDKNIDLHAYVNSYLEEEIRAEAVVRNVGNFARFLELAAVESGNMVNFNKISQEIGIASSTVANYYQILEDCLIAHRIDPITTSKTRRNLTKTSKYLMFDMGVRRLCTEEDTGVPSKTLGQWFEQFVGLELLKFSHLSLDICKIHYWRDHNGPEVDYVISKNNRYIPVEVKWTTIPKPKDCRHLQIFITEYEKAQQGFVVCRTPHRMELADNITAIPWQEINTKFAA